jgi:putative endopeptidase
MRRLPLIALAAASGLSLTFVACSSDSSAEKTDPADPAAPATDDGTRAKGSKAAPEAELASGIDKSRFDTSVRAEDDLYRFVNGTWLKTFEIPADKSNYGSFTKLADEAEVNLKAIIDEAAASGGPAGSEAQKVGDAYNAFMNEAKAEELKWAPLQAERDAIAKLKTHDDVVKHFGHLSLLGVSAPMGMWVNQDLKQSTEYITYFSQSGLGLPDRDYYFKEGEQFDGYRKAYVDYIEQLLTLAGDKKAKAKAKAIFDLEKTLADKMWTRAENRDRDKTYNKKNAAELKKLSKLKWTKLFEGMELDEQKRANVIVFQPPYAKALGDIVPKVKVADWKTYLELRLLDAYAPYLHKEAVDTHFAFHGKALSGQAEQRPRWKRGVSFVEGSLGEAVGKIYVDKHFKPEAKARMVQLVENLKKAFATAIDGLEWMSDETKQKAHAKLGKFTTKIGYPDAWRDYSALEITSDDLVGNAMRANMFEHRRNLNKVGGPIDRTEWFMTPQTINAYYNPPMNEIVFPAAILQPPFFNMEADDAVNYGAIGAVIGHELGHGFDDQGRKSDGDGNLVNWWTSEDEERFKTRSDKLVGQYDQFNPIDDLKVNGRLTLGENIGDLGGMTIAYKAYELSLGGKEAPVLDGFTGPQRFFIGWSQIWGRKYRDEELRRRLVVDPHSPSEYRVNGVVANMPEFYSAFGIKEGDKLWLPEDQRVKIW